MNTYGTLDSSNCHHDTSNTLRGAKCYATRNGYDQVSIRYSCSMTVAVIAKKMGGKWHKVTGGAIA